MDNLSVCGILKYFFLLPFGLAIFAYRKMRLTVAMRRHSALEKEIGPFLQALKTKTLKNTRNI